MPSTPNTDEPRRRPSRSALALVDLARVAPDRPAIADDVDAFTAAELDELVGALAARLVERAEPGPDAPWLPIVVDRSARAGVAIHAAIRSGRRFAPIDAAQPPARVAELLARLGHPDHAVVSRPDLAGLLPPGVAAVDLPAPGGAALREALPLDPEGPGCVIFTSGSTGRPKAVVKRWRAFEGHLREVDLGDRHVIAQTRPFSFSGGLRGLGAMASGHTLQIVDPAALDVERLVTWLDEREITFVHLGSALASTILSHTRGRRRLPRIQGIQLGGQPATWDLVPPLRALASPELSIVSSYGATEVGSVFQYTIGPDHPLGEGPLTLGPPLRPDEVALVPVETGSSSLQMLVANPESMGYLDDPELEAVRHVTDEAGVRWWRSGDLMSVDERGHYAHRGRVDDMVKINGLLVEPSEAERALNAIPGVTQAVVLPHRTPSGAARLVAHLAVDDDLTPDAVRAHLRATLPRHLVPAALVRHGRLPLTPRNKVDRERLRSEPVVRWRTTPARRPSNPLERAVVDQLGEILELGDVGPDDDIWELGLDSLGALELCSSLVAGGFPPVDPTMLLTHRTAAEIARLVALGDGTASAAVVLNPDGRRQAIVAIPGGGGTAFEFRSLARDLGSDQPLAVIEPRGMHRPGRVDRTVEAIVATALTEALRLDRDEPWTVLGYSAGGPIAFELARRLRATGREVHLVLLDTTPYHPTIRRDLFGLDPSVVPDEGPRPFLSRIVPALRRRGYWLRPGPPRYDPLRYDAFARILRKATVDYRPEPSDIDATIVHRPDTARFATVSEPLFRSARSVEVSGDHFAMMHPPHHGPIVDAIRGATDAGRSPRITS